MEGVEQLLSLLKLMMVSKVEALEVTVRDTKRCWVLVILISNYQLAMRKMSWILSLNGTHFPSLGNLKENKNDNIYI